MMLGATKFRVAHILPWATIGGVEKATLRVAAAVAPQGFEGVAFCVGRDTPVHALFSGSGVDTVAYASAEPSIRNGWSYIRASLSLARELKRQRIDLVHCSDLLAGYHAALAARLARIPSLCHIRCEHGAISQRDQSFLGPIQRFAFVSKHTRSAFAYRGGARRGSVIYDGLEIAAPPDPRVADDVRSEFGIPAEAAIVGMVARVAPIKDYPTLIRAARRVVDMNPNVRFLIVGDHGGSDTYRDHFRFVQAMLTEAGLVDHFVFTGFRSDVARLLGAMDIVALVTHSEGLPLVLLEAMAMGKPVIATAVGGIPELVTDAESGLLHRHADDAQLAGALLALLTDPARARRLGATGRDRVATRFSPEQAVQSLTALYREMLCLPPVRLAVDTGTVPHAGAAA